MQKSPVERRVFATGHGVLPGAFRPEISKGKGIRPFVAVDPSSVDLKSWSEVDMRECIRSESSVPVGAVVHEERRFAS